MTKQKKGMDIVTKMSIVGGLGLVCILIVVGIIAFAIKDKGEDKVREKPVGNEVTKPAENTEAKDVLRTLAVIKENNLENQELSIVDIENGLYIKLKIDGAVDIKDEYGTLLTVAQLKMGDIIESKYDKNTMRAESVHITAQTWERKNIQKLVVDEENKTIQLANDLYKYTSDLVTTFNGEVLNLDQLDPVDTVTVKGYKDTVWTISLEKTHGFIVLMNHGKFIGGTIDIGKTTYDVTETTKITVPIGVHNVIVAKEGMSSFITQIMVEEKKEVEIDVGAALAEDGIVSFNILPSDVTLYINNEKKDFSQPLALDFGSYSLRVEKENYMPWESTLVVNKAVMVVDINMNQQPTFIHVDNPVGSSLYIDGNYIGIVPIEAPISLGYHEITLKKEGYYSKGHPIQIDELGRDAYFTFPELIKMPDETPPEVTTPGETINPDTITNP